MKSHSIIVVLLAAGLVLSGCAGMTKPKPYVSDPEHSFAWNVARAGGIKVKDVPWEEVQKAREEALAKGAPVADSGPSALGAASYGVVHGLSTGSFLHGGLGALSWLSLGGSHDSSEFSAVLVWMPKAMAASPEKAGEKIETMVRKAYEKALAETVFPPGYTVSTELKTILVGKRLKRIGYFISGNECDNKNIDARYHIIHFPMLAKAFHLKGVKMLPDKGVAPNFVFSGECWTCHLPIYGCTFVDNSEFLPKKLPKFPDLEVFRRTSENLPDWVSIYLSPASKISMSDENGGFKFLELPLIMNKGKTHFFVEPPLKQL